MINMPLKRLIITSLWVLFMSTHSLASVESSDSKYAQNIRSVRAAYWPASDDLSPSSIDTKYFTHIYYDFIQQDPQLFHLSVTEFDEKWIPKFINGLRYCYPPVKTLLSIRGGSSNSTAFSFMASNKHTRKVFINSKPFATFWIGQVQRALITMGPGTILWANAALYDLKSNIST